MTVTPYIGSLLKSSIKFYLGSKLLSPKFKFLYYPNGSGSSISRDTSYKLYFTKLSNNYGYYYKNIPSGITESECPMFIVLCGNGDYEVIQGGYSGSYLLLKYLKDNNLPGIIYSPKCPFNSSTYLPTSDAKTYINYATNITNNGKYYYLGHSKSGVWSANPSSYGIFSNVRASLSIGVGNPSTSSYNAPLPSKPTWFIINSKSSGDGTVYSYPYYTMWSNNYGNNTNWTCRLTTTTDYNHNNLCNLITTSHLSWLYSR